jgi:hypothetical protein
MNRRILAALAPLLAVAACAVAPAAAQATEPHWYFNGNILTKKKAVKTEGGLTLGPIPGTTITISCKVRDADILENPASGGAGVDKMKAFKIISCGPNPCPVNSAGVQGALKVTALKLPWVTRLIEVPPIADEISGIELAFSCKKTGPLFTLSGTLFPWVNPGSLEFTSATGTLSGVPVIGFDNLLPTLIEAKNP